MTGRPSYPAPQPLDSFIGRVEELQAVQTLLATHRLLTLTGAAGVDKTRLALRITEEMAAAYPDGVCFVELVELADPERVPQVVAAALGSREEPDRSVMQMLIASSCISAPLWRPSRRGGGTGPFGALEPVMGSSGKLVTLIAQRYETVAEAGW
jgi:hypothetical protein